MPGHGLSSIDRGKGILSSGAGGALLWAPVPSSQSGGMGLERRGTVSPSLGSTG